jgi:hypothetical protein
VVAELLDGFGFLSGVLHMYLGGQGAGEMGWVSDLWSF